MFSGMITGKYCGYGFLALLITGCAVQSVPAQRSIVSGDETFGHYEQTLEPDLVLVTIKPEDHARLLGGTVAAGNKPQPGARPYPPRYTRFLERLNRRYGLRRVGDWPLPSIDIICIVFENEGGQPREGIIAALANEPEIESAQAVQQFATQGRSYNDPYLSLQHGFHSMQASSTHRWSRGDGVRVAVIDTGLDHTHPDLAGRTELTRNFVDRDEQKFLADRHGTAIGGVIAAEADNATGIVGIAPGAKLLAVKACWYLPGNESRASCNSMTLAKALNYSISEQVDIINLSLTGPPDPLLHRLVEKALEENIVVIGAKPPHGEAGFPVSVSGTITAALPIATSDANATPDANATSDAIGAPGRRVLSTSPGNEYAFYDGSSFSSAHIAGLAALVRSLSPGIGPERLRALLEQASDPVSGVVSACEIVRLLLLAEDGVVNRPLAIERCV